MDEGRKRVIAIMASILAARKLSQYPPLSTQSQMPCAGRNESWKKLTGAVAAIEFQSSERP